MIFEEALICLRNGEKIKRKHYISYLMYDFKEIGIFVVTPDELLASPFFRSEDILADDWEIVKNES